MILLGKILLLDASAVHSEGEEISEGTFSGLLSLAAHSAAQGWLDEVYVQQNYSGFLPSQIHL